MNAWPSLDTSINIFRDGKHSDEQVRVSSKQDCLILLIIQLAMLEYLNSNIQRW